MLSPSSKKRIYSSIALVAFLLLMVCAPSWFATGRLTAVAEFLSGTSQRITGAGLRRICNLMPSEKKDEEEYSTDELLGQVAELRHKLQEAEMGTETLKAENQHLSSLLKLSQQTRLYSFCVARTIVREPLSDYYSTIVVDHGASEGVKEGQAVLTRDGLIGMVASVTAHRANVRLLGNPQLTLSCQIPARRINGIVTSKEYSESIHQAVEKVQEEQQGVKVIDNFVAENRQQDDLPSLLLPPQTLTVNATSGLMFDTAKPGDQVVTSSLGNANMLDGIIIGTVEKCETDTAGAPRLLVRPAADMRYLPYVLIVIPSASAGN